MTEQEAFLDAIGREPDNTSLLGVYADWLQEHGLPVTVIHTHEEAVVTKHEPGVVFVCSDCKQIKAVQTQGGTGYGYGESGLLLCYECCGEQDRKRMIGDGKIVLYLEIEGKEFGKPTEFTSGRKGIVGNWCGTLKFTCYSCRRGRHNIARNRYDVHFTGPDICEWHGVTYGDNTQACHCKRTKQK